MADIFVQQGTLVSEVSLIPFIRKQDIVFDADNLRPYKIARMFFDEIAVNRWCQKSNKIVLNSKKRLTVNANSALAHSGNTVYQGTSFEGATFTAKVDTFNSGTGILVINNMSGNFDESAVVYVQNANGTTAFSGNIISITNQNTSDIFYGGEELICPNNNIFFQVIGTSGENILYVNENFVTIDVSTTDQAYISQFKVGELVFQNPTGVNRANLRSYLAKVVYVTPTGGSISLQTINGTLNVHPTDTEARLWNGSNRSVQNPLQCNDVKLYDMQANNVITSIKNPTKNVSIVSHIHSSGIIANTDAATDLSADYIYVSSSNTSIANGNLMYFTAGSGLGQLRRVIEIDGKKIRLNSALTINPTHTTKYSLGNHVVDENGSLSGIFNLPAEPNFKFKTGERVFTVTDTNKLSDTDFTMKASAKFTASGLLNKAQRIVTTPINRPMPEYNPDNPITPLDPTERTYNSTTTTQPVVGTTTTDIPRIQISDGLSQTFFTPKTKGNKVNSGIFATSIDLFFKNKPSTANGSLQLPVTVKIAEVKNGYPTKNYLAAKTIKAKDVKVSTNPSTSNAATYTKFTFNDPVYLLPDSEYAIVVSSESPEYELYIAEIGGNVLGADPPRRISEQPYAGSLFKSQNATTWTPYQNQDLMFVVNKAKFNIGTSSSATFNLEVPPGYTQNVDRVMLHSNQLTFPKASIDYRVKSTYKSNNNFESVGYYVAPHKQFLYGNLLDAAVRKTSLSNTNSRLIQFGNANSIMIVTEFASSDEDISPVFNQESLSVITSEHNINNGELPNTVISVVNRGVGYNAVVTTGNSIHTHSGGTETDTDLADAAQAFRETFLDTDYDVGFYAISISGGGGTGANGFAVANTTGTETIDYIVITEGGSGYIENPTITIAPGNTATSVTAAAIINGETGKSGGNIRAKYLTRQIVLEDGFESGDLRVFMDCIRPNGTDIQVYYKVLSGEDSDRFTDKRWVRMLKKVDKNSKSLRDIIELEFKPNLDENKLYYFDSGQKYPIGDKFKYFAIKVCMLSEDEAVIPTIRNLRIIAAPEG